MRRNSFFFLPRGGCVSCLRGCFYSHISTRTFRRALTASVDSCAEIKSTPQFSGVTKSGRVWRNVPESDARSVPRVLTIVLRCGWLFLSSASPQPDSVAWRGFHLAHGATPEKNLRFAVTRSVAAACCLRVRRPLVPRGVCDVVMGAFRHLPPNSARFSYASEEALFISVQLSADAVSAPRKVWVLITPRASLSGTLLQTLPDLVTLLKGYSLSPRCCPATRSAPSERFGY